MDFEANPAEERIKTAEQNDVIKKREDLRSCLEDKINNGKKDNVLGGKAYIDTLNEQKLNRDEPTEIVYTNGKGVHFKIIIDPKEIFEVDFGESSFVELRKRLGYLEIELNPNSMNPAEVNFKK